MANSINKFQKDQLREVINIGVGNAATALSELVAEEVDVSVPEIRVDRLVKMVDFFGQEDEPVSAVLLKMKEELPGMMVLIFPPQNARDLARILTNKKEINGPPFDEEVRSSLKEVGNILAGSTLRSLSDFIEMSAVQSVPNITTDMAGAVTESILAALGQKTEEVIGFKVNIKIEAQDIKGQVCFLFDPHSTEKVLKKMETMTKAGD